MFGGKKEDWGDFPAAAAKAGYGVLAIDMRGHGKSENPLAKDREKKDVSKWGKDEWMNVLKDIKAAKTLLAGKEEVNAKKIVLVGAEVGANLSLVYAADDAEVRGVAVLSPGEVYKGVSVSDAIGKYDRPLFGAASNEETYSARSLEKLMKQARHKIHNHVMYQAAGKGTKMFGNEDRPGDLTVELLAWLKAATN
jgi:alpha-beta hydrolase superfamily lysophospholipase